MATRSDRLVAFGDERLTHQPGLDGLRGLAVLAILCFHGNFGWMVGGWLGVSLFFTLSGFLITSLMLTERNTTGSVSLRSFWSRRFRRLLPVAWVTLAVVLGVVWWIGTAAQAASARGDILASLAQVANWRFLIAGQSYAALFRSPSPVLHFWSLAIEEQFYLLFPMVVAGLLAVTRGSRRLLVGFICVGLALSWSAPIVFGLSLDRTYFGTDTRAGELLVGALLAVVMARPRARRALARQWSWRTASATIAVVAFAAMMVLWIRTEQASGFVTSGGLALHGGLAVLVIVGVLVPSGPLQRILSVSPLRWLGRVSYGVYLFHWPLLVFLTEQRTGLPRLPRFALVVAVSLLAAELSARVLEGPIRRREGLFGITALRPALLAPLGAAALIVGSLTLSPIGRVGGGFDPELALARMQRIGTVDPTAPSSSVVPAAASPTTTVPAPPKPTVAFFGDSVGLSQAVLFLDWTRQTDRVIGANGSTELGCGVVRGGQRRSLQIETIRDVCNSWPATWASVLDRDHPSVAALSTGQWETVDRKLAGDNTWRELGDPVYDERVHQEYLAATDLLASRGALVVWVTLADFGHVQDDLSTPAMRRSHDPARVHRLNDIMRQVVAERPSTTRLVDLAQWMEPHLEDTVMRDDGAHYFWRPENPVIRDYLGPAILSVWEDFWRSTHDA